MTSFQERLNQALDARDMKASELAKLSGVNEGAISQYRKGKYKASQQTLDRLAKALNVSIPWLMGAEVPMQKNIECQPAPSISLTTAEQTHIKKYRQLDADGKEEINDLIDVKLAKLQRSAEAKEAALG